MSEQEKQQRQEVPYAAVKASAARSAILRGSAELLTWRARVEKYLQADPKRAGECYEELLKVRSRLTAALGDARLALLELEEYARARTAGKLQTGLAGFNLMSRAYKPLYEALRSFADKLPENLDSVNAKTIGRLMNQVRMGYYPTDPENIRHILRGIRFPEGVTTNVFDPCCGCGKALRQIAQGNNCFTYGVELDESRAEEAQTRLHRVGVGSFFHSRISSEAFHLLFLNPPYLSVLNQGGGRARHEKRFLVESMGHLMIGGLLIYIIPYYRLTPDICRILGENFDDLTAWRVTDGEFKKFKQAVILGLRKKRIDDSDAGIPLERYADPAALQCVTQLEKGRSSACVITLTGFPQMRSVSSTISCPTAFSSRRIGQAAQGSAAA